MRRHTAGYGHVSACLGNVAAGVHYFDFSEVSETDEFGNVIDAFPYCNYGVIAGAGATAAALPYISDMPLADSIGVGLSAKLLVIETLEPGDGSGLATDLSFLLRLDDPAFGEPYLTRFALGVPLQNLLGTSIVYESEHAEEWVREVAIGRSIEAAGQVIALLEATSRETFHFGVEWSPGSVLALRCGLKREGVDVEPGNGSQARPFRLRLHTRDLSGSPQPALRVAHVGLVKLLLDNRPMNLRQRRGIARTRLSAPILRGSYTRLRRAD